MEPRALKAVLIGSGKRINTLWTQLGIKFGLIRTPWNLISDVSGILEQGLSLFSVALVTWITWAAWAQCCGWSLLGQSCRKGWVGFMGLGSFMSAAVTSVPSLSMDIPTYFVIFSVINDDEVVISWALSHRTFCRWNKSCWQHREPYNFRIRPFFFWLGESEVKGPKD